MLLDVEIFLKKELEQAVAFFRPQYNEGSFPKSDEDVTRVFGYNVIKHPKYNIGIYEVGLNNKALKSIKCKTDWEHYHKYIGVADDTNQIVEYMEKTGFSNCVVFITPIYKDQQTPTGGWRWHKWGQYIGKHKITSEYLYDEPDIDQVLVWEIIVIDIKKYNSYMES